MSERARQVLKHIDMIEHLRDAMERPEPKLPGDWLFNWLETSNPWLIGIGFVLALGSYIFGLTGGGPMWLIMAMALAMWSWAGVGRRSKAHSDARRAEFKAQMAEFERLLTARAAAHRRFQALETMMVPEWML